MKYKLQDFEDMTFVKRVGGGKKGGPEAKLRYYKEKYYFQMSPVLVEDLNFPIDADRNVLYAVANFPSKHMQLVINPINKNIATYRLKVRGNMKTTNNELTSTFLSENGYPDNYTDDILLDWETTFKQGKMMAIEFSVKK